ncbi:hypothetical protein CANINC_000469 [Pichia inconspicua]|uniref:2'-phosphotransferase n=1 Tax=Pichia inconspicua TaxID=52247 RepID=A0A4T0X775_9ASCO|nr:hypothetical protein CANINC_000469 [[Candida] inconspicua]
MVSRTSPSENREYLISKTLSKLLRHRAGSPDLPIDENGYVSVNHLLAHNDLKCKKATLEDIKRVVETNDKRRFAFSQDGSSVCALQGHSISLVNTTPGMQLLDPKLDKDWPKNLLHGTYENKLTMIQSTGGLSRMKRNHVHFTSIIPPQFSNSTFKNVPISGVRNSCNVLIFLDITKIRNSTLPFYKSANNVYLTPGDENGIVSSDYFLKIVYKEK